ncbi:MAG TPA: TlpA disulfide reductase family protein [Solirubrobacterales bacterium]|nr:TlpA disulfide reductase family protein [Solirubrobacterales bacterium]
MRLRSVIAVLVAVAVVALLVFGLLSKGNSRIAVGEEAPAPELAKLGESGKGSLKEYRGKWVLVNFWASWCEPCREEAPALVKFQGEHGGKNFTVVGIDTQDISDDGAKFAEEFGLPYPLLHDGGGDNAHEFGTTGVPENFLLEPNGKVAWETPGPVDAKVLEEEVVPLLPPKSEAS